MLVGPQAHHASGTVECGNGIVEMPVLARLELNYYMYTRLAILPLQAASLQTVAACRHECTVIIPYAAHSANPLSGQLPPVPEHDDRARCK